MNNDQELKGWASDWQSGSEREPSAEAIRVYAQGRGRFMWTWVLLELTVGGIALPVLGYMGWMATDHVERWAMWLLSLITVAAMSIGWWNWRGSLLATASTTAEFVAVSTERLRRMRQAWRIGWIVLVAQVAVFSVWIWNLLYLGASPSTAFHERFAWGWLAFMSLSAVAYMLWLDRRLRLDQQKFESLKRDLL